MFDKSEITGSEHQQAADADRFHTGNMCFAEYAEVLRQLFELNPCLPAHRANA